MHSRMSVFHKQHAVRLLVLRQLGTFYIRNIHTTTNLVYYVAPFSIHLLHLIHERRLFTWFTCVLTFAKLTFVYRYVFFLIKYQ